MRKMPKRLAHALTVDEQLFQYFMHLNKQLEREHARLIAKPSHIQRVIRKGTDGDEILQIHEVFVTPEGTIVYVT